MGAACATWRRAAATSSAFAPAAGAQRPWCGLDGAPQRVARVFPYVARRRPERAAVPWACTTGPVHTRGGAAYGRNVWCPSEGFLRNHFALADGRTRSAATCGLVRAGARAASALCGRQTGRDAGGWRRAASA